ncbi:DUF6263 family protein [Chitinophaga rhizophila]|uniref:Uncharacterized protein n=1 Tax=Chitinophaga rhizophila TaxID=2866212 RepID=A0ABS7G6R6_9BACT|nr:DUF6263 family protein [Chitinophaga rhizophila]MBW8683086.1 hypothetical protein [Chitinophaga rhizophila]
MTRKTVVLLVGLISISTILTGQVKKTIIPVLHPGEQYIFRSTIISDIHEDGVKAINQSYSYSWFLRVIGKNAAGKNLIRATYLKINHKTEHLFTRESSGFNSDDFKEFVVKSLNDEQHKQNDRLRKLGEGMMGKSFTLYFDENMQINEVTGLDTLINIALAGMEEENTPAQQEFEKSTRGLINNEEVQKIFENAFAYVTEDAVGVGDKWSSNETHNVGPVRVEYVVKSEDGSNLDITASSTTVTNNDIQVAYSRKGTITVDSKTGMLVNATIKDDMKPRGGAISRLVIKTMKSELQKK